MTRNVTSLVRVTRWKTWILPVDRQSWSDAQSRHRRICGNTPVARGMAR